MTDSSCQATESGKLSVHTHTLTIQALFGNVIFSPLKGVPCVSVRVCVFQCVCVCFSWMLTPLGLSPTWFFQKPNRLKRAQLHDLSLSLPFPPSLFLQTFIVLCLCPVLPIASYAKTHAQMFTNAHRLHFNIFPRSLTDVDDNQHN